MTPTNKAIYGKNLRLGILGGGQLGRMFIPEAIDLDVHVHVLDPAADAPCAQIAHSFTQGDFRDYQTVLDFGRDKDVLTIEIEDVNIEALRELRDAGVKVCPNPDHVATIKDKGLQKQFYRDHGIASSSFRLIESGRELTSADLPCVLKARTGGYDGKGVSVLRTDADIAAAFGVPCVVEDLVDIEKELSVIITRNAAGQTAVFPVVELVFDPRANLVDFLLAPAQVDDAVADRAKALALQVADAFAFEGILAVELFLTTSGELLVNEVAPRTHNSGHHTIEANYTSQFAQHLRAILNLPPGDTRAHGVAAMVNLVGEPGFSGPVVYEGLEKVLSLPGVYPHLYGKSTTKPFRKMGHVTVLADDLDTLRSRVEEVKRTLKVVA